MADIQYANAYTEVLDILKHISKEDYEKIPKSKIKVFEENSNKNYNFIYDENKILDEQNVSEITKVIIAILFRDYWATKEQRYIIIKKQQEIKDQKQKELMAKFEQNKNISEKDLKKVDVASDLDLDIDYKSLGANVQLYKREEGFFEKLVNKIKGLFNLQGEYLKEIEKNTVTLSELIKREKEMRKEFFLHFTRKGNQEDIEKKGLDPKAKKENAVANDNQTPVVYFSEGLDGMFETLNTWVRFEYYMKVQEKRKERIIDVKFGSDEIDPKILEEVHEKMYNDLKDRMYYSIDLEEGVDYLKDDIDDKKIDLKTRNIPEFIIKDVKWQYGDGEYSNFDDIKQERWNRNTIKGKVIEPEKLTKVISEKGDIDALTVVIEQYERYDNDSKEKLKELSDLVNYCKEKIIEEKEVSTKEGLEDDNKDIKKMLISQVYDKFTDIEQMHIVEKTLENDEKELMIQDKSNEDKENEIGRQLMIEVNRLMDESENILEDPDKIEEVENIIREEEKVILERIAEEESFKV